MKWKVEYITAESSNILMDDLNIPDMDKEAIGMGFPIKLAERLVSTHNKAIAHFEDIILGGKL